MKKLVQPHFFIAVKVLVLILMISTSITAQTQPVKSSLSYDQTVTTRFEVAPADMSRLLDFEKMDLKPVTEVRNTSTVVDQNGDITTTITIRSSDGDEPWMNKTARIVIDRLGVKMFDATGKTLVNDPYTTEQLQSYNNLKQQVATNGTGALPDFRPMTASDISNLQSQGYAVQSLADGSVKARKGDTEMIYNTAGKSVTTTVYDTQNKVLDQTLFAYKDVNGKNVPNVKVERSYSNSSKGVCIGQVTTTIYSNYNRMDAAGGGPR
jgi:hypothetical protein